MNRIKRLKIALALVVFFCLSAFLHYSLPQHDVVQITGVEVRRVDRNQDDQGNQQVGATTDVWFVFADDPDTGEPRVYRNQDTRFGFPFYLKFDSANTQARAQSAATKKATSVITHYGWRIEVMSMFPNATAIRTVEPGYVPTPWFNILFLAMLGGGVGFVIYRFRRFFR